MAFPTDDVLKEVSKLEPVQKMRASVQSAVKYGAMIGASAIAGGIIAGPVGLAVGGIVSSCLAGKASCGQLQSVPYIIMNELTHEQRRELAGRITNLLESQHVTTIRDIVLSASSNADLQAAIVQILIMFLSSELGMCIKT
ncbi:protein C19orf12 homolog [Ceratina calcarata]|uniref:Protein C19orf12 homolog n=1 Tax=Ceratina calcarata TaxID=156304 RepID=A0AAJ7WFR3_9HYME|nr:protein C19orf12 homolog [Ceratina calcarata]